MDAIRRIKELTDKLNFYRNQYYNLNKSLISDQEYDNMFDELKKLEEENNFYLSNSPCRTVGYEIKSELQRVKHNHPMLSLDKTKSVDDLVKFLDGGQGVMMLKLDGLTCSLRYLNGKLVSAETRGNGEIGEDILHNAKVFSNIPLHIDYDGELIVDGEAIITHETFERINEPLSKEDKFKNVRNLASGSVRQLDSKIAAQRDIRFIAWKVINCSKNNSFIDTLVEIEKFGFEIVPLRWIKKGSSSADLEKIMLELKNEAEKLGFPIDGMVIGFDDIEYGDFLGATTHHLRSQIAFKYAEDVEETVLTQIDWTCGKTGVLTPTAVFEPVELAGTTVERASVHNVSVLLDLELLPGDIVEVYKANEIIPQIKSNLSAEERDEVECVTFPNVPKSCPVCGGETKIQQENDSQILICTNPECKGKLLAQCVHFASRNAMDIVGLSESTLKRFIDLGWITKFADIYELRNRYYQRMTKLDGFGKKSVDKLLAAIEKSRHTTLDRFIYALCIPMIGRSASKTISNYFNGDWDKFFAAYEAGFDWTRLEDFGEVMSKSLNNFMKERYTEVFELIFEHFELKKTQICQSNSTLNGKTFVVTGNVNIFKNREELKCRVESCGGKVVGSISKNVNFLVNNDSESKSSKNVKAKQLGVTIITEEELMGMLGEVTI